VVGALRSPQYQGGIVDRPARERRDLPSPPVVEVAADDQRTRPNRVAQDVRAQQQGLLVPPLAHGQAQVNTEDMQLPAAHELEIAPQRSPRLSAVHREIVVSRAHDRQAGENGVSEAPAVSHHVWAEGHMQS
jgi:hypothetical protein